MRGRLEGRVAIVTGASQGIGAAIAERFAAEGAHVALCARREGPLAELVGAIKTRGGSASFAALDVAALFLASDDSTYVTGACLSVDGGRAAELVIPPP